MNDPGQQGNKRQRAGPWVLVALFAILVLHGVLVGAAVRARGNIWHDEAISMLSATGHQDEWHAMESDGAHPYGAWVPAEEFQYFVTVDRPLDLQGVSRSVGDYDHHPPLFYWLLHVSLAVGVSVLWAGPVVNIVLSVLIAVGVYRLVTRLTGNEWLAVAAVAATLLGPAFVMSAAEALLYELLALALLCLGCVAAWIAKSDGHTMPSTRQWAALAAVTLVGMLTHHQFVFYAVAAVGVVWLVSYRWSWRAALIMGSAVGAGAVVSYIIFPYFFAHTSAVTSTLTEFDATLITGRLSRWATGTVDVITFDRSIQPILRIAVRLVAVAVLIALVLAWRPVRRWAGRHPGRVVVVLLIVVAIAIPAASYGLQRAPEHAYGTRYVAFLWPLATVAIASVTASIGRRAWIVLAVISIAATFSTVKWITEATPGGDETRRVLSLVADGSPVFTDCASRGYFPTVVHALDADTMVYLSTATDLDADVGSGWSMPSDKGYLLHSRCPRAVESIGEVLDKAGLTSSDSIGRLERYEVRSVAP